MLKIKRNLEIYEKWENLQVSMEDLASVVKEDTDITCDYFNTWLKKFMKLKNNLTETYQETLKHVENSK